MSDTFEEFRTKFRLDDLTIHQSKHWAWSVRPVQATIGSGILSLRRFCTSFAEVTEEEHIDLGVMVKHIEKSLQMAFSPQKMNYLMLMMVDNHVHFHVLPRYSEVKHFANLDWIDSGWPKLPALGDNEERSNDSLLTSVKRTLK